MASIMEISRLRKSFGSVRAVDDISFEIPEGICFGLLGPNGAGKTTTIEMMEGILAPSAGNIFYRGNPIDRRFKERVGIQFQSTALPEFITVKETLELFRAFYPNPRSVDDVVDICSLGEFIDRDNRKLSGGQRQRLLLGIAIIPFPDIVFLDEPTTGLDPQARRNFWSLIERIRNEKTTVVLTTHYMDEAELLCDEVAIMDHGHILELDTPERLLQKHFEGAVVTIPNQDDLSGLPEGSRVVDDHVEIVSNNLDTTVKQLLENHRDLDGLNIHKPDLEDLFIKLTGSSLRA
ncbi:MAG: ABC transporter ATP-binding protein [Spirochaetia bacterium]